MVARISTSFLFIANSIIWIDHILFIYSSVDACFHFLAVINNARLCVDMGFYLGVEWLGPVVTPRLTFLILFSNRITLQSHQQCMRVMVCVLKDKVSFNKEIIVFQHLSFSPL